MLSSCWFNLEEAQNVERNPRNRVGVGLVLQGQSGNSLLAYVNSVWPWAEVLLLSSRGLPHPRLLGMPRPLRGRAHPLRNLRPEACVGQPREQQQRKG